MNCYPACPDAAALIRGGAGTVCLSGHVRFYQERRCVLVVAELTGLPQDNKTGYFAMHIHEGEHCTGNGFPETGSHYNPDRTPHPSHAGDLPTLMRYGDRAYLAVRTDRFCAKDVIGRTVVIHAMPDDYRSQPAGNAGEKIACGVICKC